MSKKRISLLSETESLERLMYRLPENHPKLPFLKVEHYRTAAGKRGEERLQRKFSEFVSEDSHRFLRNVCLSLGDWKVQMDGLLLTERGAVIIESKNISGQIHFDELTDEFSRTDMEGVRTVMEDPAIQLNKHIRFLAMFFKRHKINLPVKGIVVFTSKHCEFIAKPKNIYVCKTYQLIDYLFAILQTFPPKVTHLNLSKVDKLLQKHQNPYKRLPLCQLYVIDPEELEAGILCTHCKKHSMLHKHKIGWVCAICNGANPCAFQQTVQEYFSLIDQQISNKQLRKFSKLESKYAASRLLATFDLEQAGALRNRTYRIKKND